MWLIIRNARIRAMICLAVSSGLRSASSVHTYANAQMPFLHFYGSLCQNRLDSVRILIFNHTEFELEPSFSFILQASYNTFDFILKVRLTDKVTIIIGSLTVIEIPQGKSKGTYNTLSSKPDSSQSISSVHRKSKIHLINTPHADTPSRC